MNKQVKKLWLKALRSGEYKQGKHRLVTRRPDVTDEFCCLGVLQSLYYSDHNEVYKTKQFDRSYLTVKAAKWAEVDHQIMQNLSNKNDGYMLPKNQSFKQIANYIEKHL